MNRKIVFRGKDKFTGEWRYGDLVHNKKVTTTGLEPRVMVGGYEVLEDTVGQFTSLRDRNEKEIYEGDIIKSPLDNIVVVEFRSHMETVCSIGALLSGYKADCFECTGWIVINIKTKEVGFMDSSFLQGEVIGNIFDNT